MSSAVSVFGGSGPEESGAKCCVGASMLDDPGTQTWKAKQSCQEEASKVRYKIVKKRQTMLQSEHQGQTLNIFMERSD